MGRDIASHPQLQISLFVLAQVGIPLFFLKLFFCLVNFLTFFPSFPLYFYFLFFFPFGGVGPRKEKN